MQTHLYVTLYIYILSFVFLNSNHSKNTVGQVQAEQLLWLNELRGAVQLYVVHVNHASYQWWILVEGI